MRPLLFLIPLSPLLGFLFNFTIGVRVLGRKAGGPGHDDHGQEAHHAPSPIIRWCVEEHGPLLPTTSALPTAATTAPLSRTT